MPKLHLRLVVDAEYDIESKELSLELPKRLAEIPMRASRDGLFTDDLPATLDGLTVRVYEVGERHVKQEELISLIAQQKKF